MIPAALVVLFVAAGLIAVAAEPNFATPAALAGVLIPVLLLRRRALAKASEATPVLIALALFAATVWAASFWGLAGPMELAERAGKITLFALAGGIALCLPLSGRGAVTVLIGLALGATAVALALAENSWSVPWPICSCRPTRGSWRPSSSAQPAQGARGIPGPGLLPARPPGAVGARPERRAGDLGARRRHRRRGCDLRP